MSLGLLFPGQGSQLTEALTWLAQPSHPSQLLPLLQQQLGSDWRQRSSDTEWASRNEEAQGLVTGLSLAAWEQLQALLPKPGAVAGYSVGELSAFSAAGVFSAATAMHLARQRAAIMDAAVAGADTGLLALTGTSSGLTSKLCQRHALSLAIQIAADHCVLGGNRAALQAAQSEAIAHGASCHMLPVALASHTPALDKALAPLAEVLAQYEFARPESILICNFSGRSESDPQTLRQSLASQVANTVRWDQCMRSMVERGVRCVLEVGPGIALAKLWNSAVPEVPARSLSDFRGPTGVAAWVRSQLRTT